MRILYNNIWKNFKDKFSKDFTLLRINYLSYEDMLVSSSTRPTYRCDKCLSLILLNFEFKVIWKNLKVYVHEKEYKKYEE